MNISLPKILITGGQGQLACALRDHALATQFDLTFLSHHDLDIAELDAIEKAIAVYQPHLIINAAAYTAVDKAEQEIESATKVNYFGVKNLASACQKNHLPLIHLSTDYVFAGTQPIAYSEEDLPHPINVYGKTKLLGEEAVIDMMQTFIILRVSGIFSEYGHNFLKTMLRCAGEKKELRIVSDQVTCPTYACDIAETIFTIAKQYLLKRLSQSGVYHYCSGNPVSWYEFANAIFLAAKQFKNMPIPEIKPVLASEYKTPAARPAYSVLACDKICRDFGIKQPQWELGVRTALRHLYI